MIRFLAEQPDHLAIPDLTVQPMIQDIQKKYAKDQEKQQAELARQSAVVAVAEKEPE